MENFGVIELSSNEMIAIDGGKSLAYWFGYAVGNICGTLDYLYHCARTGLNDGFVRSTQVTE